MYTLAWRSVLRHTAPALLVALFGVAALAADPPPAETVGDPYQPVDELALLLKPLTAEQLAVEADAWLGLVQAKVRQISEYEIAVKQKNRAITEARAEAAAAKADTEAAASQPAQAAEEKAAAESDAKTELLADIVKLREERTALIDRLNVVLDAWDAKGGDPGAIRQYVAAVAGITADVDVTDVSHLWTTLRGWLVSKEGGVRWAWNIGYFLLTLIVFWILARIAGNATRRALSFTKNTTDLLRNFASSFVQRAVFLTGLLLAVTMLEISIGPVLAVVGAAGFVVAFALQGTLSNFASGLLILAYRPFDVGDVINAAGVSGTVQSMNLVTTQINTFDNQRVIVPNNSIWGGVITNVTGLPTRRVDMTFGISYTDDADQAAQILDEIVASHPLVLRDPAPVIKLHELADSSVNLICRPWSKTADYWTVYWDVTKTAKQRFDAAGITIPFPQRDVHVYQQTVATTAVSSGSSSMSA